MLPEATGKAGVTASSAVLAGTHRVIEEAIGKQRRGNAWCLQEERDQIMHDMNCLNCLAM